MFLMSEIRENSVQITQNEMLILRNRSIVNCLVNIQEIPSKIIPMIELPKIRTTAPNKMSTIIGRSFELLKEIAVAPTRAVIENPIQ